MSPLECPDFACWRTLLLDASLPAEQRECLERHLESCPSCQDRLDQEARLCAGLQVLACKLGDPTLAPADPTLAEFVSRLGEALPSERTIPPEPLDLFFLRGADRPDLLGILDGYEVQEVIGQGGMGVVLKAFEPALHRPVAIKVLAPALAGSAVARRRFTREAQAAAAVCHEHVVAVHGVHEAAGMPYLVMQYVPGESLQARLDRIGPLEVVDVVRIGMQTASGLAAAHAQGLIHRDIKPANLLLENGMAKVKITDFGLARLADDVGLTRDGVVAGTPEYMAPEQARGEAVDHRADLFSLGSVLYALCTGRPPFRGSTAMSVLRQVSEMEPAPIRTLNPDVPEWLETVIARLMAKNPAARFQSATEVAALLEGYLAHLRQPITIPVPPVPSKPEDPLPTALPCAGDPRPWYFSWSGVLLALLVVASLGLAAQGFDVAKPDPGKERVWNPPTGNVDVWSVALSPDGKIIAAGAGMWDQPGEVGVWNLATREPLQRYSEELGVASVALSPNGKLLASGSWSGHVRVHDWAAGKQLFDFPIGDVARVAFSPDGQLLATATEDKAAQLWDLTGGKLLANLEGDVFRFHYVTFSPDGSRVLAGGGDWKPGGINQVTIWEVATRKQVLELKGHESAILVITYSPDGKTIATGSADRTIRLWDAETGERLKTLSGHLGWVEAVVFTPDGKTLISGGQDRTIRFWDVEQGKETKRIPMRGGIRSLRFTPEGDTLIVGGGFKTLKLFAVDGYKEKAALWNGAEPMTVPMDLFPFVSPTKAREKGWLGFAGLLGLGLAFVVSLSFAVGLSLRRRRTTPPASGEAPGPHVSFPCTECGRKLKVKVELAGKKVRCPRCSKPTHVPEASAITAPPSPARPRRRREVLAAFALSGVLGALLVAGIWQAQSSHHDNTPFVSRLEVLANRVKAERTNVIDARPYPSVTDRDLEVLRGLTNLKVLNLDHTETTDQGMKAVAQAGNLVSLSLTNTQVTDTGLAELRPLTGLDDLRLDRLPITDAGLAQLSAFPRLAKLSLYHTGVTDEGMVHLKQLPSLERLSLDETQVGDEGLRHLGQCRNLKYVSVWHTRVTEEGIQELRRALPRLQVNR
jgi:serine/threonine protein kinase